MDMFKMQVDAGARQEDMLKAQEDAGKPLKPAFDPGSDPLTR